MLSKSFTIYACFETDIYAKFYGHKLLSRMYGDSPPREFSDGVKQVGWSHQTIPIDLPD